MAAFEAAQKPFKPAMDGEEFSLISKLIAQAADHTHMPTNTCARAHTKRIARTQSHMTDLSTLSVPSSHSSRTHIALNATREALSLLKIEDHSLKLNCSTTSPARYKKGPVDSNRVRKPKSKVRKKNKRNRKKSAVRGRAKNLASTPIRANRNRRRRNSSLPRWLQKPEPAPENQDPWMPDFAARRSPDATFRGTMLRRLRPGIPEVWRPASKAKTGAATKSKGQEQVVSLDGFYHIKPPAYHEDVWGSILTIDGKSVYANNDGEPFWCDIYTTARERERERKI